MAVIDTSKVAGRRELRFSSLGEAVAEAERLAAADGEGRVKALGNWTLGQAMGHLAYWVDGAYDGFEVRPPWWLRLLGPMLKKTIITRASRPGFRLPGVPGGTYGTEVMSTEAGLAKLRAAYARLEQAPPAAPNPVFGRMKHDEWKQLHLRHAEGHLGFFVLG